MKIEVLTDSKRINNHLAKADEAFGEVIKLVKVVKTTQDQDIRDVLTKSIDTFLSIGRTHTEAAVELIKARNN